MTMKMLHASGVFLGAEADFISRIPTSPEGHWENKRFVKINSGILAELGGAWDHPPPAPDDWTNARLARHRAAADALFSDFEGREPWGWKDPRNCLTLPFWQSMLTPLRVVLVVRNPLEVARSLRKRHGMTSVLGLALWKTYNERLHDAVETCDHVVTHYDRYFQDPEGELRRILHFLDIPIGEEAISDVRSIHAADMRHHRLTIQDLRSAGVPPETIDLYQKLCAAANWIDDEPTAVDEPWSVAREPVITPDDDPDAVAIPEYAGRAAIRLARKDRLQFERQLEESQARVVELEQTVEALRRALAECQTVERELIALRQQLAAHIEH